MCKKKSIRFFSPCISVFTSAIYDMQGNHIFPFTVPHLAFTHRIVLHHLREGRKKDGKKSWQSQVNWYRNLGNGENPTQTHDTRVIWKIFDEIKFATNFKTKKKDEEEKQDVSEAKSEINSNSNSTESWVHSKKYPIESMCYNSLHLNYLMFMALSIGLSQLWDLSLTSFE